MKFLALIYNDENAWESLGEDERNAVYEQYRAFSKAADGKIVEGAEAAGTKAATTVRVRDGQMQVTDGPAEHRDEPLGGFYLFECESFDEALELAKQIPGASSGAVEVWPEYVEAS